MTVEQWRVYADITNGVEGQIGTTVGTSVAVGVSSGLFWYLEKAGIELAGSDMPTTGRIYPR